MAFFFTGELLEVLEVAKQIDPARVVGIAGTGLWEHACGPLELWVLASLCAWMRTPVRRSQR